MTGHQGRPPTGVACREAQELELLGEREGADAVTTRVRVDRHVGHCAACQAVVAGLQQTRTDVRDGAPPLDDVRRARILARLSPAIDELAAQAAAARPAGRRRPAARLPIGKLAFALAAVAVVGALALQRERLAGYLRPPTVASSSQEPAVAPPAVPTADRGPSAPNAGGPRALPPLAPQAPPPALIEPYRVVGRAGVRPDRSFLQQRFQRLQTAAGTTVRARVGERTRVSLVGPAEVAVLSAAEDVLDVEVNSGTLVADFVHRRSGRLRIHSPGAITEVVGTLFAIEVRGTQSRVSVAHGRVVVQPSEGAPRALSAGESWTSGAPAIERLPTTTAALLADHDAATRAGSSGATSPAPSSRSAAAATAATPTTTPTPAPHFALAPPATAPGPVTAARAPAVVALTTPARAQPAATPRPAPGSAPPTPPVVDPAPATAASPPAPARTPEASYRDAETAMRRRDWTAARRALEQVANGGRNSALEDVARYELAQLAMRTGDQARAAHWLEILLASDREPALRESTRYLRCEVRLRAGDTDDGRRCLQTFRASYPDSTRDASALGWLLRLSPARPACAAVQALADEYLRRHPAGADAPLARQRKAQCTP